MHKSALKGNWKFSSAFLAPYDEPIPAYFAGSTLCFQRHYYTLGIEESQVTSVPVNGRISFPSLRPIVLNTDRASERYSDVAPSGEERSAKVRIATAKRKRQMVIRWKYSQKEFVHSLGAFRIIVKLYGREFPDNVKEIQIASSIQPKNRFAI